MITKHAAAQIDRFMEQASESLVLTRYFKAEQSALRALRTAHDARDYERMARVLLPLQEARRQKRQLAADAGLAFVLTAMREAGITMPGCYLVQPPMIGAEARDARDLADRREIPAIVITREPLTRAGRWPIVAVVGTLSVRTQVEPPRPLERVEDSVTKDHSREPPPLAWFLGASEALGDAAIAKVNPKDPAAWRVDDLVQLLDAHPDHEKLHQRLAEACRAAMGEPEPTEIRRKTLFDRPVSF